MDAPRVSTSRPPLPFSSTPPPRPNARQSPVTKRRGSVRPSFLDCPRRTVCHSPPARGAMSGPNTSYDPVEVTPLNAESIDAMVTEALAAFAAATSVVELKQARLANAGDRSPIALANREIGALPPQARKDAGVRVGRARGVINEALKAREVEVKAAEVARILVEERVDVTLPVQTQPFGAVHPVTALMDLMADVFIAMAWEVAEGP